jgi:hypothetical protein
LVDAALDDAVGYYVGIVGLIAVERARIRSGYASAEIIGKESVFKPVSCRELNEDSISHRC